MVSELELTSCNKIRGKTCFRWSALQIELRRLRLGLQIKNDFDGLKF